MDIDEDVSVVHIVGKDMKNTHMKNKPIKKTPHFKKIARIAAVAAIIQSVRPRPNAVAPRFADKPAP